MFRKRYGAFTTKTDASREELIGSQAFWTWGDSQHPTRNTRLDKALAYVKNRKRSIGSFHLRIAFNYLLCPV